MSAKISLLNFLLFSALFAGVGCTKNLFVESANKDTPEAKMFEAERALNKRDYTAAINIYTDLPAEFQARRDVNFLRASAHAGRCGLELLTVAFELQEMTGGQFIKLLMQLFGGSTAATVADCIEAQELLVGVSGDPLTRTVDENLLLAFVSITKLGAVMSFVADQDVDGEPDVGWDHCVDANFPEAYVREMGTGIALLLESLGAAGSDIAGGTLTSLNDACAQDPAIQAICDKTDGSTYTADEVKAIRALVSAENFSTGPDVVGIGIGACNDLFADCICF